ncbi:radical SAM protein [Desulfobacula phenolica]|uniref:Pyruvate-formate lyase-activating enzyme n=1 Tax=Desulfobacula phenolica TaxID=90732 RepID=A0A1H2FI89_9BACT|nr:radical SAM protein [Desulfobacula phenolica]SDU07077.1 Pyruvate-formate lyase-activating enzyme [Desulfobacula phenolica]
MKCNFCERRCDLTAGNSFCGMYREDGGRVVETYPDKWCTYFVSRVESVPFYHAYPGSRSMIIGTAGCNFRCRYCSNGFIACRNPADVQDVMYEFSPEKLVAMAQKLGCHNIVFNVNEPAVSLPSLLRVKAYAKKAGIPMGCLTNGYTTQESTRMMADIFSFVHVGLKGFSNAFYKKYVGVDSIEPILRNIKFFADRCHLEIASPVIEDVNDHELFDIATFIHDIHPHIPWHVFRLLPEHNMKGSVYPNIERMNQALESSRNLLPYVYFHNFVGSDWVNTLCPNCGATVIKRFSLGCSGDQLDEFLAPDNTCINCCTKIAMLGTKVAWDEKSGNIKSGDAKNHTVKEVG